MPTRTNDAVLNIDGYRQRGNARQFGDGYIAGVVAGEVRAKLPYPRTHKLIRPLLDPQVEQIGKSLCGLIGADQPGNCVSSDDVAALERQQARRK